MLGTHARPVLRNVFEPWNGAGLDTGPQLPSCNLRQRIARESLSQTFVQPGRKRPDICEASMYDLVSQSAARARIQLLAVVEGDVNTPVVKSAAPFRRIR